MKIITLQQPWAGAVVHGRIDLINARYATKTRGDLFIHAGRVDRYFPKQAPPGVTWPMHQAVLASSSPDDDGCVIGVVEIDGVAESEECQLPYVVGGPPGAAWVWLVKNPRVFLEPVAMKGYWFPREAWRSPDNAQGEELAAALKTALPPKEWSAWYWSQKPQPAPTELSGTD